MKKSISLIICCVLLLGLFSGCGQINLPFIDKSGDNNKIDQNQLSNADDSGVSAIASDNQLRAAVLYDGSASSAYWEDTYSRLAQPLLLGLEAEAVDISGAYSLESFDILYPDESIMAASNADKLIDDIVAFANDGGGVFLTNGFYDFFDKDFIGAKSFHEVEDYPYFIDYPEVGDDLGEMQEIMSDFFTLYEAYYDFPELEGLERGVGLKPSTAVALAVRNGLALASMNEYGDGYVFFASGLLPNPYCISGTSLESRDSDQVYFADTSMSAARLLENSFASFISKRTWGYSAWRVFGSFGAPAMSWELHFEAITAFADGSGIEFAKLCEQYNQIPSYTLIRSSYTWFLRAESITSLIGQSASSMRFAMDVNESAYSSGTHVAAGDKWLTMAEIENAGSYFADYPQYDFRAYPYLADLDGDGDIDILSGSSDGKLRLFDGQGYKDRLITAEAVLLTDSDGNELSVPGYSAPVMADLNGDGFLDILCGAGDGKIYLFSGGEDGYTANGAFLTTDLSGQCFPDLGDLNSDGYLDIVVGSNEGRLLLAYGNEDGGFGEFTELSTFGVSGDWLAPRIVKIDSDSKPDIAIGTFDGYISTLIADGNGGFSSGGYIELDEMNYKGNYNAKFGNNCVPFFVDINADGITDLVCGSLEYGIAYPIDSEYFPEKKGLFDSLDYFTDHGYYLGIHFYTNAYASAEREDFELAAHIEAMQKAYGVGYGVMGVNQHTWYTSSHDAKQSLLSSWRAGLLWNSGYAPANDPYPVPQASARNVISLPFYLTEDGENTILLQNCSTVMYSDESLTDISAKYDMPVCLYYHCDFTVGNEEKTIADIETVEAFRQKHGYNFVSEDQLMYATAAAYNLSLDVVGAGTELFDIELIGTGITNTTSLYSGNYQTSCGVKISLGEALADKTITTDADVWYRDGNNLYVGLNRPVRIYESDAAREGTHVSRINLPAAITSSDSGATVSFKVGGLMQVTVDGEASTKSKGWETETINGQTVFTRFGDAASIVITFED